MSSLPEGRERGPLSPCINVCAIGVDGLCGGCLRDRQEIAGWIAMSAAEQWQLMARLEQRWAGRAARAARGAPLLRV